MRSRSIAAIAAVAALGVVGPTAGAGLLKLRHQASLYADAQGTPLRYPQGVGCGGDHFVVADSGNGRVLRVEVSGTLARATGIVKLPEISYPIRVDGDASGALVVLDGKSRRLARVRADGTFAGWIEIPPAEGVTTVAVRSFALGAKGVISAADTAGRRIAQIAPEGGVERSIALPSEMRSLSDIAVDARGSIYALDGVGRRVWVAHPGEAALAPLSAPLTEDLDFPGAIEADPSGRLLVTDLDGGGVVILGPDGSFRGRQSAFGWKEGLLRYPTDICSSARGLALVADRENQRVQVFAVGE